MGVVSISPKWSYSSRPKAGSLLIKWRLFFFLSSSKLGTLGERHCGFLPPGRPAAFARQLSAGNIFSHRGCLQLDMHPGCKPIFLLAVCCAVELNWFRFLSRQESHLTGLKFLSY